MVYVLIISKVQDYEKWKNVFDEHSATRKAGGCKEGRLFRNIDDQNEITIIFKWDTIENAKYTAEICKKIGYKKPLLVTSAYHMKRSVMSFEKAEMKVIPVPVQFKTWGKRKYGWEAFLPKGFENSHRALHEYLGLLFYKFAY